MRKIVDLILICLAGFQLLYPVDTNVQMAIPFLIPAIISALGMLGSTALSKKKTSTQRQQETLASEAASRSKSAYDQLYPYYTKQLAGNFESAGPEVGAANATFERARQNLINNAYSRGGGLDTGLAHIESGRARTISDIFGGVRAKGAAGLAGLAGGDQGAALNTLANARTAGAAEQANTMAGIGGIGNFIAQLLPSMIPTTKPTTKPTVPNALQNSWFTPAPRSSSANTPWLTPAPRSSQGFWG